MLCSENLKGLCRKECIVGKFHITNTVFVNKILLIGVLKMQTVVHFSFFCWSRFNIDVNPDLVASDDWTQLFDHHFNARDLQKGLTLQKCVILHQHISVRRRSNIPLGQTSEPGILYIIVVLHPTAPFCPLHHYLLKLLHLEICWFWEPY